MKKKLKKIEQEIIRNELIDFYWKQLEKLTGMNVGLTEKMKIKLSKKRLAIKMR